MTVPQHRSDVPLASAERLRNSKPSMRVLLLGPQAASINDSVMTLGGRPHCTSDPVIDLAGYDIAVSFGYRHRLAAETLAVGCPVFNLHLSRLPWNRGAHPNVWAHLDGTPHGVTLHRVDAGLDTGPIIDQWPVSFAEARTWRETYDWAAHCGRQLLIDSLPHLLGGRWTETPQRGLSTYHAAADLPAGFPAWDCPISDYLPVYDRRRSADLARTAELLAAIEETRARNNVNWMDVLRLSFRHAPAQARALVRRINGDDQAISRLLAELGDQ